MVHRYLKTCVLSACVAALCGGRAFGAWFLCKECNKPIWDGNWGSHRDNSHHDNKMPEWFDCNRCYVDKDGTPCNKAWHKDERLDQEQKIPSFEEHVQQNHRFWKYTFWCPKCKKKIDVNSWIMHLYWECKCYDEIYEFEKSDFGEETFRCSLCKNEGKEAVFPLILKYEHLRDKHPECLPERKYYCKDCKETVSEADWQKHDKEHSKEKQTIMFYCLMCKEEQKERYEEHMAKCHNGKCPFCEEVFKEENRRQHMEEKHGFPCPICDKQVDTLLGVHVYRQHPYFEGPCKCRKLRPDENGNWWFRPCEYPSYLVSGLDYIRHLTSGVHLVGVNNENIESFFAWCPRNDFLGPFKKTVEHASLKHKGCFFYCEKCRQLDFDCSNEKLHFQVKHDRTHWWCRDCAQVFEYKSEDKQKRSAFRCEHLLTMHKKCPVCCRDVACMKDLDSHSRAKHPEKICFWCFSCNACIAGDQSKHMEKTHRCHYCEICHAYEKGDQSKHMEKTHPECGYCEICGTWVSNPSGHHSEKHKGCFFCRLCLGIPKDRAEHIKNVHSDAEECVCGEHLLPYEVYEDWHVAKHSIKCPLCNEICSPEHMVTAHKCKKGACKPIASTEKRTWEWQCDPFYHCPLRSWGCEFTSEMGQLDKHMQEDHKCKETCRFDKSKSFVHDASCKNGPAFCSLCKCDVANREPHWVNDHGCKEGCPVAIGQGGKWHQADCKKWTLARCLICWDQGDRENATDVDCNHIFQKHFPNCKGCHLIQDSEGVVSIQHQGHSNETEEFAPQHCDVIENEEKEAEIKKKEAEIEEKERENGNRIEYDPEDNLEEEKKEELEEEEIDYNPEEYVNDEIDDNPEKEEDKINDNPDGD